MNSNNPGEWDDTTAPDTNPHRPRRSDYAWLIAPLAVATMIGMAAGWTLPDLMPKWAAVLIAIPAFLVIWLGGTLAVATWKARQERARNRASGGES